MFVGWDWASTTHDVTVIDDAGDDRRPVGARAHRGRAWTPPWPVWPATATLSELPVAIERASGLVVDRLLAAGHPVIPIHPNAFHAARPRWGAAGAKSDPGDSYKLADYLRTDGHRLRRLRPWTRPPASCKRCRGCATTMSRQDRGQQPARRAAGRPLARRQADLLPARLPDRPGLPGRLPDPAGGRPARRGPPGRLLPAPLLPRRPQPRRAARAAPAAPAAPVGLAPEVLTELVGAQVRLLRTLLATIAELDRALGAGLLGHAKARLLAPLPRIGEVNLAQVVAEVGPILDRAGDVEQASAECGAAPVTRASGKSRTVTFRLGGQHPGPQRPAHLRQQLPAQLTLGGQALRRRPPPRQAPPPRRPHPRPRLAPGHVGLLAHRHHLRPRQTRRRTRLAA